MWSSRRVLCLSRIRCSKLPKFKNTFFIETNQKFCGFLLKFPNFPRNCQWCSLKARGLIFKIIAICIHILIPVKTEFTKTSKDVNFILCPPCAKQFQKYIGLIRVKGLDPMPPQGLSSMGGPPPHQTLGPPSPIGPPPIFKIFLHASRTFR